MATNTANEMVLSNITLIGKCEDTEDSSYTRIRDGKEEVVSKVQLSLAIHGMQERLRVELAEEVIPSTDLLSQWELDETWLVVSATSMRAFGFTRSNARPGEKTTSAFVVFTGSSVREATPDERKQLQAARKAQKTIAKQRRKQRAAEKAAAKQAATDAGPIATERSA